jgi:MFS family permease
MSTVAASEEASAEQQALPKSHFQNTSLVVLSVIIVVGIFASTMPQPQVLGRLPLTVLLKNQLHSDRGHTANFFLLCGLLWYFKPLWGILTDAFPLFGTRRRNYILAGSFLAACSWLLMVVVPHTYNSLLAGCILVSVFMVMISTVTGAILVEIGQARGATGRLTSVRQMTQNACTLINGPIAGWLASGAFMVVAGVNAVLVFSIFPVVFFLLKEKPEAVKNSQALINAGRQSKVLFSNGTFWLAIVFVGLFYFAPGLGTITTYRQLDTLKLTTHQIGLLQSYGGATGILAAFIYGAIVRRFKLSTLITFGIATAALGTLFYLRYDSYALAIPIDAQNGFFFTFAEVSLIDLAARATPAGCEGLGYSCILSMRNLSLFGADSIGSNFADKYHWSWEKMVWINAVTTAVVLILLPFMPKRLMGSRDGLPNSENTGEPEMEPA